MRYNWLIVDYNHAYYGNHQIHHSPDHIKDAAQTAVHCWPKNWEKKMMFIGWKKQAEWNIKEDNP